MKPLLFSDLDGTLLDHDTYAWDEAAPALAALKARDWPLVLCSSKTRAEMTGLHQAMGLTEPFIAEGGGGLCAPAGHPLAALGQWREAGGGWLARPLGLGIAEVRARLARFGPGFGARGFGQMTDAEVAELTGLPLAQAALARAREFNEPVVLPRPEDQGEAFAAAARAAGLGVTRGGRFWHLLGGGDKGQAVRLAAGLYRRLGPVGQTVALGDSPNDFAMLEAVDRPVLVARPGGGHAPLELAGLTREPGVGPAGWNAAVLRLLAEARP